MKTFFYQLAQNPKECLIKVAQEQKFSYGFLGYALGVISVYFAIKLNSAEPTSIGNFIATFIFWFIVNIIANFILAALTNLCLEFIGCKSKASGIFILLGLSQIVLTLLVPCFLMKQAFAQLVLFTPLFLLAILFLQIYTVLSAMKQTFETSKAVSLFAFMFSIALPFIASFGFTIFLISFIATLVH